MCRYLKIEECESNNGTGFGVTVFVAGCQHHCKGCFNKESWDRNKGIQFGPHDYDYLKSCLSKPYITRLTISGGDPMALFNRDWTCILARSIKQDFPKIKIWVYTGYTLQQLLEQAKEDMYWFELFKKNVDFLVDGRYDIDNTHTLPFRGSDNQKIWRVKDFTEVFNG